MLASRYLAKLIGPLFIAIGAGMLSLIGGGLMIVLGLVLCNFGYRARI